MRQVNLKAHEQNPTWRTEAKCRGLDAELFHPERGGDVTAAKAVCQGCPVTEECLAYALVHFEKHGIWGGTSEKERRPMRVHLVRDGRLIPPITSHGTTAGYHAHRYRGQEPCDECRDAHRRYQAARKRERRSEMAG